MALLKRAFIRRISGRAAGLPAPPAPHSSSCDQDTRERDTNGVVRATSLMNRYVVLARSAWPRMRPASCPSNVATLVRYQTFHSTAPAGSIGFKNFKNSPRLDWKTQKEMDARNAEINAKRTPHVTYAEALKSHRPRAWVGARKKVAWGRLFGGGETAPAARSGGE